jgi:hypothetical protein
MATFIPYDTRLMMRYPSGPSFSFSKIRTNATNSNIMNLANAFASIQDEQPNKVSVVVTRMLF